MPAGGNGSPVICEIAHREASSTCSRLGFAELQRRSEVRFSFDLIRPSETAAIARMRLVLAARGRDRDVVQPGHEQAGNSRIGLLLMNHPQRPRNRRPCFRAQGRLWGTAGLSRYDSRQHLH